MISQSAKGRLYGIGFWSVTCLSFLSMYMLRPTPPEEDTFTPRDQQWLALPVPRSLKDSWRSDWARLCVPVEEVVRKELPVSEIESGGDSKRGLPVVLQGTLQKRDGWMCLLFDTQEKRWFHLSEGEEDERSGLVFESGNQLPGLVLLHRESGERYVAKEGSPLLKKESETDAN